MSYLTEESAAERWCPETRAMSGNSGLAAGNRPNDHPNLRCIGSACMMWRWQVVTIDDATGQEISTRDMMKKVTPENRETFRPAWGKVGYCGLAGNPG